MRKTLFYLLLALSAALSVIACGGLGPSPAVATINVIISPPTVLNSTANLVNSALPTGTSFALSINGPNTLIALPGGTSSIQVTATSNGATTEDLLIGILGTTGYYDIGSLPAGQAGTTATFTIPLSVFTTVPGGNYSLAVQLSQNGQISLPANFTLQVQGMAR